MPKVRPSADWLVISLAGALTACLDAPVEVKGVEVTQARLQVAAPANADEAGPPPIVVHWEEAADAMPVTQLAAVLENTTDLAIEVELELIGTAVDGSVVGRAYGRRNVPAGKSLPVVIPVRDLPAQSVGASSMFNLVARYELALPEVARLPAFPVRRRAAFRWAHHVA